MPENKEKKEEEKDENPFAMYGALGDDEKHLADEEDEASDKISGKGQGTVTRS